MKALFITSGGIEWASARIRGYWPAAYMSADVVRFDQRGQVDADQYDAFIFQKVFSVRDAASIRSAGKRVYWDLCDPIHWFNPDAVREMLPQLDGVVCSSEALREDFGDWCKYAVPVHTIPDRMELSAYPLRRVHDEADPVRFIWYGIAANRIALFGALTNLERLACNGHNIALTVFDERPGDGNFGPTKFPVYYSRWLLSQEADVISSHDVALLPPYPGPWGRVKSNNKCLTAWACGLPVTDGMNYDELVRLVSEPAYRQKWADTGRDTLETHYDVKRSAVEWEAILCK